MVNCGRTNTGASTSMIVGAATASLAAGILVRRCCTTWSTRSKESASADARRAGDSQHTSSTDGSRLVFITGASGSGKTTLGEALRKFYGFVHIDGDRWTAGLNPVSDGLPPSQEELQTEVQTKQNRLSVSYN